MSPFAIMAHDKAASLRRLFSLARPHLSALSVAMVALLIGTGINLALPEIVRRLVDHGPDGMLFSRPWATAAFLVGLFGIQAFAFYGRSYLFGIVGQQIVAELRRKLYEALVWREIEFFDRSRASDLVSRLSSDTLLVQDAVSVRMSVLIRYSVQVIFGIILMLVMSARLTLVIVAVIPILVGISMMLGRRLRSCSKRQQAELGASGAIAEESFSGARVIKAFNQENRATARYQAAIQRVLAIGTERARISAFFSSFVSFLMNACIVIVLLIGVRLVVSGGLTAGQLTAFLLYGVIVAVSFAFLSSAYAETVQSLGAAERVFELIDISSGEPKPVDRVSLPDRIAGGIRFERVGFSYPTRPDDMVLRDLSLEIEAGKTTALVGRSGSGKSTIVSLIMRFYDPVSGAIFLDGIPLVNLDSKELRRHIAYVPQDPHLFGVTIAENLRYGKEDATLEELEEACRKASILSFVESLPHGFDTQVGERGTQLSGGQRQRLAIARAILRDPAIMILDEATSALDSENEFLVREAIAAVMAERTCIVIAHRLSTVQRADSVIVIDSGAIVQQGRHDDLCREEGLYRQIVERQELRPQPSV